jgi:LuxR family maltose regulon positive regulatory protein
VLAALPPDRVEVMRQTSLVGLVSAGLIEALTERDDAAAVLADLEGANAVIAQRGRPEQWYRHHPLLAPRLYEALWRESPQRARELHRRAASWYAGAGMAGEAIRHALAAGNWSQAEALLERGWADLVTGGRAGPVWGPALTRPETVGFRLALAYAAERLNAGDVRGLREELRLAEQARLSADEGELTLDSAEEMVEAFRIAEARLAGDYRRACALAGALLARLPHDVRSGTQDRIRAVTLVSQGVCARLLGDSVEAERALREGLRAAGQIGLGQAQVVALSHLGYLLAGRGRLREALGAARQAVALAGQLGLVGSAGLGWAQLAMVQVHLESNQHDQGLRAVEEALDRASGDRALIAACRILEVRLLTATASVSAAFDALAAARQHTIDPAVPARLHSELVLAEADLWARSGDPPRAHELLAQLSDPAVADAAAVLLAETLLSEGKPAAAAEAIANHVGEPVEGSSLTNTVTAGVVSALAACAMGDRSRALHGLQAALRIAEVQGHRRALMSARVQLRDLLDEYAHALNVGGEFLAELALAMDEYPSRTAVAALRDVVEPLTEREQVVLRYLRGPMSNDEIAARLYVSVNTVKTHLKNIYRKLGANRRREAVRKARDLRLL